MSRLCSSNELAKAIDLCVSLLSEEELRERRVREELIREASNLRSFLQWVRSLCEDASSIAEVVGRLEESSPPIKNIPYFSYLGGLLDGVQIAKSSKRTDHILRVALKRTGHEFLINENSGMYRNLLEELSKAESLYHMLHVLHSLNPESIKNPLSGLRNSMGKRTPEEYFCDLVVGWFLEEVFLKVIESKGIRIISQGVDARRKVLFSRSEKMGRSDFSLVVDGREVKMELQRVGRGSIKRKEPFILVQVREHKPISSDFIVFWIGRHFGNRSRYRELNDMVLFVPHPKLPFVKTQTRTGITQVVLHDEEVRLLSKRWEELVRMSKTDFLEHIRTILSTDINYTPAL